MAKDKLIIVKHRKEAAIGGKVAGADGQLYHVAPNRHLHKVIDGNLVAEAPGCDPEDAEEFARFPKTFEVDMGFLAPPPPPPAAGASAKKASAPNPGSQDGAPATSTTRKSPEEASEASEDDKKAKSRSSSKKAGKAASRSSKKDSDSKEA